MVDPNALHLISEKTGLKKKCTINFGPDGQAHGLAINRSVTKNIETTNDAMVDVW